MRTAGSAAKLGVVTQQMGPFRGLAAMCVAYLMRRAGRALIVTSALLPSACSLGTDVPDTAVGAYQLRSVTQVTATTAEVGFPWAAELGVDGRIYLATDPLTGMVVIADSAANKVGTFGRVGDGPGELRHPAFLARKGDSLVIVQASKRQAMVLTPDGRFARELAGLEVSLGGSVFIRGDSAIVPRVVMDEERFGYPLQLVTPEGHIVRSFGTSDRTIDPRVPLAGSRILARASDSSVWVGGYLDSRLELWTSGGILERTVPVDLPWLIRDSSARLGSVSRVRPQPALQDLHCCLDGRLAVIYQRPRADWRPASDSSNVERPVLEATELLAYIEQVVVMLNPETGAVLAELSDPSTALGGFLEDGRIFGLRADESGRQLLVLMEIHPRAELER